MASSLLPAWILVIMWMQIARCAIVMEQDEITGCNTLEGSWEVTVPNSNVTSYYRVTRVGDGFLHIVSDKEPATLSSNELLRNIVNSKSVASDECEILMRDGSTWTKVPTINHVHLIFMNHLDVGYNVNHDYPGTKILIPGYIVNVLNWYFQVYFPKAAQLGDELREIRANETFIYTTHPWLVNLFLDCPDIELSGVKLQCPSEEQVVTFRRAVWMGDIVWHAGPLNLEAESSNPELFSYSLTLSQKLDDYFGFKKTARTLSQRDIPGMTQAAIPYLVQNNIVAASFGINPSSAPPDVPSPNVWKFGNYSIITYWHKGGYPNDPGTTTKNPGGLSRKDCQFVNGLDHVLCFAFKSDNLGPPNSVEVIRTDYAVVRSQFPGAEVKASTFEAFTALLVPLKDTFPVVTQEIGDTWIQGPASDPIKMSHYRAINRLRAQCVRVGLCSADDKRFDDMSRLLVKLPEHTYGLGSDFDTDHWSNELFQPLQYIKESFINNTKSYLSHRAFNDLALGALKDHPLRKQIDAELRNLEPYLPDLSQHKAYNNSNAIKCANGMVLKIGAHGELVQLTDLLGRDWANETYPLARILYRTYNTTDINEAHAYAYDYFGAFWKTNLESAKPESRFWDMEAHGVYVPKTGDPCSAGIYARVIHSDMQTWFKYGAPVTYFLKYTLGKEGVDIDYQFFNKPSTRLVEALFLSFQSPPNPKYKWYLHKVGYLVDPMNVVLNGSQYVHAIDFGVGYLDSANAGMFIESPDVATVVVQTNERAPSVFPVPLAPFKTPPTGMAFNFYNNVWETNFVFWYPYQPQDKHYKARFRISFT